MIRAVFFDFYQTLVYFEPPREELHASALKDFGIDLKPEVFRRPLAAADDFIALEMARSSASRRSEEERIALWVKYEEVVLKEAGIENSRKLAPGLLGKMRQVKMKLALFDDVIPALTDLKGRGLILGLISNIDRDMAATLEEVGLQSLIQVVVTSLDVGFSKPHPEIFKAALSQAGVPASEAVFVGDHYRVDVVGANQAGIKGVLLDRNGYYTEITDCPCIQSLSQVVECL